MLIGTGERGGFSFHLRERKSIFGSGVVAKSGNCLVGRRVTYISLVW